MTKRMPKKNYKKLKKRKKGKKKISIMRKYSHK